MIVEDMGKPEALDEAVQGVYGVIHDQHPQLCAQSRS